MLCSFAHGILEHQLTITGLELVVIIIGVFMKQNVLSAIFWPLLKKLIGRPYGQHQKIEK